MDDLLSQRWAIQQVRALKPVERHFPARTRVTRPKEGSFLWLELPPEVDTLALDQRARACVISTALGVLSRPTTDAPTTCGSIGASGGCPVRWRDQNAGAAGFGFDGEPLRMAGLVNAKGG